eukprot:1710484-Karenia_brevis.AAC.1
MDERGPGVMSLERAEDVGEEEEEKEEEVENEQESDGCEEVGLPKEKREWRGTELWDISHIERSWCDECVRCQGQDMGHRKDKGGDRERESGSLMATTVPNKGGTG